MFRRLLLVLLAGLMLLSVAACGQGGAEDATQEPTSSTTESATQTPAAGTAGTAATQNPGTTVNPTQNATSKPSAGQTTAPTAKPTEEPIVGGTLYQLADSKGSQMNSYVIQTENNKVIIMDGGYDRNKQDLINLAKEITGQAVPEIEAWIFSHTHSDHVNAFSSMFNESSTKNALNVKKLYYNITSREYIAKVENESSWEGAYKTYDNFVKALNTFPSSKRVVVQQGDVITIDGIKIEVMLVPDETVGYNGSGLNDASVIYRVTIGGQRILFLGDGYKSCASRLYKAYKNDFTADVVQMSHHGSQGFDKAYYKRIAPKACLWPSPQFMWADENQIKNDGGYELETVELHRYMRYELNVKYHYMTKDGNIKLEFPLDLK
ncbi:MAG: MBL fold metallo-hydrolase [Clostridia bacterium]|nr:MBL fold metallo-hydrolase [Clostridia bacterium]